MSEKSELYNQLKAAGVTFEKGYVHYTVPELEALAVETLSNAPAVGAPSEAEAPVEESPLLDVPEPVVPATVPSGAVIPEASLRPTEVRTGRSAQNIQELTAVVTAMFKAGKLVEGAEIPYQNHTLLVQDRGADRAGLTYSTPDDQPIRVDTLARIWFMDEVAKPAIPKARMTRKTRYMDPGVKQVQTHNSDGSLDEIYETAGDEKRELTTTVTLPSWQVGKYRDVRLPFLVHSYNEARGFDYVEVNKYYGGRDLVPASIKTLYVGNQLCYDIVSTRSTIENQFAQLRKAN